MLSAIEWRYLVGPGIGIRDCLMKKFILFLSFCSISFCQSTYHPGNGGGGGGGTGTVTSVGLSMPSTFCVTSGSPVTTAGTLGCSYATGQTVNLISGTDG